MPVTRAIFFLLINPQNTKETRYRRLLSTVKRYILPWIPPTSQMAQRHAYCISFSVQRCFKLAAQIIYILNADRQPDQAIADAQLLAVRRRNRGVGHDRRMLDQAFDAAKRLGEREQVAALEHAARLAQAALHFD